MLNIPAPAVRFTRSIGVCLVLAVAAVLAICPTVFAGDASSSISAEFRFGTASAPFSAAKRVGDFNHDGRPDVAVVDRLVAQGGETHYVLEIDVSGAATDTIAFSSTQPALDIALADIDHDGDVDIVLTPVLSRTIVAVWINDGTGRFAEQTISPDSAPALPDSRVGRTLSSEVEPVPAVATVARAIFAAGRPPRMRAPACASARLQASPPHHPEPVNPFPFGSRAPPVANPIA